MSAKMVDIYYNNIMQHVITNTDNTSKGHV